MAPITRIRIVEEGEEVIQLGSSEILFKLFNLSAQDVLNFWTYVTAFTMPSVSGLHNIDDAGSGQRSY